MREYKLAMKDLLCSNNVHKRYIAFLTALSLMITLAVPFAVPKTANAAEDQEYFSTAPETPPGGAYELTDDDITGVEVSNTGNAEAVYDEETGNWTITSDEDKIGATFTLKYKIDGDNIRVDQPYIYYWIPTDVIEILDNYEGNGLMIYDFEHYDGVAAYFAINKETGLLVIRFTEEYIKQVISQATEDGIGTVEFYGEIFRADTAKGDKKADIGDTTIYFDFESQDFTVTKSGEAEDSVSSDGKVVIDWTVTVTNDYTDDPENTLAGLRLEDERFKNAVSGTLKVDPEGYGEFVTDSDGNTYYQFYDTFTGAEPETVTFTFKEEVDYEDIDMDPVTNTATLYDEDEIISRGTTTVDIDSSTITKKGDPQYTAGNDPDTINWTVEVERPYGLSLNGYYVEDEAFKYLTKDDIKLDPAIEFELDTTTGRIKFNGDASKVKITYTTKALGSNDGVNRNLENNEGSITNNSKFLTPKKEEIDKDTGYVYYEKQYHIDYKTGSYDRIESKITWNIRAHANDGTTLDGYELTDAAFAPDDFRPKITVTFADGHTATVDVTSFPVAIKCPSDDTTATIEKNGSTLKIKGDVKNIDITYETTPSESEKENGAEVENTVSDNHDNSQGDSVGVGNRERQTTKTYLGADEIDAEKSGVWYIDPKNPGQMKRTLSWQVDMISDTGFTDYRLTDNLTTPTEPDGINHYIDTGSIKVLAYLDNTAEYLGKPVELKEGTDYTIKWTPSETNPTGFEINFIGDNVNKYHYIQVIYDSIVTLPADTAKDWEYDDNAQHRFTFKNTANGADADHTFVVQDKTKIAKTDLTVKKTWKDKSSKNRPSSITYYLERKLGENGEWERIYWNSTTGEWEVDTAGTHTYKLSASSGWTKEWTELPWDTEEHEDVYYYRAVEVSEIDGYTTSYEENTFETGVTGNKTFTIVNSQDMGMKKSIIGIDGSSISNGSTIDINNLATLNIDGTDYYIINYGIELDNSGGTDYVITDYLPQVPDGYEGFTLVHVPYYGTKDDPTGIVSGYYLPHHPLVYQNALSIGMWLHDYDYRSEDWYVPNPGSVSNNNYDYDEENHIAYFGPASEATRIEYEIKIPVSELNKLLADSEEGFVIKNNASTSTGASSSVTVTVTGVAKSDPPEEKGAIIKEVNGVVSSDESDGGRLMANRGRITYSIYVNPEGKTLSNTGEYDVVDDLYFEALTLAGYDGNALKELLEAGLVTVTVDEITDFSYDDDGNIVVDAFTPLPEDEYSYVFDDSPITVDTTTVTYAFNENGTMTSGIAMGGDEVTLKISTGVPNFKFESDNEYITYSINCEGQPIYDLMGATCDENGDLEITFIIPEGVTNGSLSINNYSSLPKNTGVRATAIRTSTIEASGARLTVTVPDEKPLKITYTYNITYNNSDLSNDSNLTISNNASINTGNVTASDSTGDVDFVVKGGSGSISFDSHTKFVKSDVGDSTIKLSGAQFYIAQWDGNGTWTFASNIKKSDDGSVYNVSFDNGVTTTDRTVPATGAAVLEITAEDYESGTNKLDLASGYLYKFIEIKVPDGGYEAADSEVAKINPGDGINSLKDLLVAKLKDFLNNPNSFKSDPYYNLLNKFVAVHYFQIGDRSDEYNIPSAITEAQITTIQSGGTIDIPDNRRININAQKSWNFTEDEATLEGKVSAQLELYWSYTKSSSGIPSDAKKATAENLGLTELENPKTVTGNNTVTWEGLPNGTDDRPIYYYVKEVSYTITIGKSAKTYKLQSDGTYQTDDGETGDFFPSYTGNAVNKTNDDPIKVTNSSHLVVYKVWKDYNGTTITDKSKLPANEIRFELWGKRMTNGREEQILNEDDPDGYFTISAPDWKFEIPEKYLTGYTAFSVKEVDTFDGYSVSYSYTVNDKTGEITITNKSTSPDEIDVSVKKVWVGSDTHPSEITVKLYRTTTKQSDNGLSLAESGVTPYKTQKLSAPDWSYKWEKLPAREDGTNKKYYYYVVEETIEGYMAAYSRTDGTASQSVTIKNTPSGDLFVDKIWLDAEGNTLTRHPDSIDVEIYYTLRPAAAAQSSAPIRIRALNLTDPFGISTLSTISNTSPKVFALGDSITFGTESTNAETDSYPAQLENKLKQSGYTGSSVARCGHPSEFIEGIKNQLDSDWYYATNTLLNGTPDFTTLIAGTNNLVNSGDPIDDAANPENSIKSRMQDLVEAVFQKGDSDHVVFVGAIPAVVFPSVNTSRGIERNYNIDEAAAMQDLKEKWIEPVKDYNAMLYEMVCEYQEDEACEFSDRIYYVDTYTDKVQTTQGVHPTDEGYEDIATAFNSAIVSYLSGTIGNDNPPAADDDDASGEVTDDDKRDKESGLPDDFYDSENNVNTGTYKQYTIGSTNGRYKLDFSNITPDANGRYHFDLDWLPKYDGNGNEYVYYVKEVLMDGYTTTYDNNDGHTLDGSTITITNQKEPSSGIEIEKVWKEKDGTEASGKAEPSDRDSITVKLTQKKIPKEQTSDTGSSSGGGNTGGGNDGDDDDPNNPGGDDGGNTGGTSDKGYYDITIEDDTIQVSHTWGTVYFADIPGYLSDKEISDIGIIVEGTKYNFTVYGNENTNDGISLSGELDDVDKDGAYVVKLGSSNLSKFNSSIGVICWKSDDNTWDTTSHVKGIRFYYNTTATTASMTHTSPLMFAAPLMSPVALTSAVATIAASDEIPYKIYYADQGIEDRHDYAVSGFISRPDEIDTVTDIGIIIDSNGNYDFTVYKNGGTTPVGDGTHNQYQHYIQPVQDGNDWIVKLGCTTEEIADITSIGVTCWSGDAHPIGVCYYYEPPYEPLTASCNKGTIIVGETAQITTNKSQVSYTILDNGDEYVSVDENGVITGKAVGTATIEVTYEDDEPCYVTITVEPAEVVREITISRGSSKNGVWDTISDEDRDFLENLPMEDENYSYLYFIEEIESPEDYDTQYFIDDEELTDFGAGFTLKKGNVVRVQVINTKTTDTDEPEVNLPNTGGIGFPFVAIGAILTSIAILAQKKRKRYSNDK